MLNWPRSDLEFAVAPQSIADIMAEAYAKEKGISYFPPFTIPTSELAFKTIFYDYLPASALKNMDSPKAAYDACKEVLMQCHLDKKEFPEILNHYAHLYVKDHQNAIFFRGDHSPHVLQYLDDTGNIHKEAMCPFASRCEMRSNCYKADGTRYKEASYSCAVARTFMITDTKQGPYFIELKEILK